MLTLLQHPWPWYVSGPMIALVMVLLLFFGKSFGFSSNLRTICAACGAGKHAGFFNYDWKSQRWNLLFLIGAIAGGYISSAWLQSGEPLELSPATIADLNQLGISFDGNMVPSALLGAEAVTSVKGILLLVSGGFLVGFGSRYAGGCTSGHAITGLSSLQLPSLTAVAGFFAGGLIMTYLLFPLIF